MRRIKRKRDGLPQWAFRLRDPYAFLFMNYKEIFSLKNLHGAHKRIKRAKLHKREVAEFELDKANQLYILHEELIQKRYKVSTYRTFKIYEPKERKVDATPYRDRIVQNCFVENYLFPLLERRLIYDNAACRKGKGTDFARKRLREFMLDSYKKHGQKLYVLTFDIHHYFESIDHEVLENKMRGIIKDIEILAFVDSIIGSFNRKTGKGVPLGNQSSQCFALYYLDAFDRIIKERFEIKCYSRYMDDGVIIHHDKNLLIRLKEELAKELGKLKLEFNPIKTSIYPIKQGITYLGFTYRFTPSGGLIAKMAKKKKKRLLRHLKKHEVGKESLISYRNYLRMRSNNNRLVNSLNQKLKKPD